MKILLLTFFILLNLSIGAQEYRNLRTSDYEHLYNTSSSQVKKSQYEIFISEFSKNPIFKKITIPVVFHILYKENQDYPKKEQVIEQLDALNYHFSLLSYENKHEADKLEDFQSLAAETEIKFCFAALDPLNNPTDGINFVETNLEVADISNNLKFSELGGKDAWDTEKYLNIWVYDLPDSISGYSQLPGGDLRTDGIVIDYNFFGLSGIVTEPYNQGKTLTHLVGNFLFLYDLWSTCYCCDDKVEDTPRHNAPNYGSNEVYKQVSLCDGVSTEMTMNYMDNTDDAWMYMFTNGQKIRMQAVLSDNGPRKELNDFSKCFNNSATNRSLSELKIFPNPANHMIEINCPISSSTEIEILNRFGKAIYFGKFNGYETIDVSSWNNDVYVVSLISNSEITSRKFVIIK